MRFRGRNDLSRGHFIPTTTPVLENIEREPWLWRSPELDQELLDGVSKKLKEARSILEGGMHNTVDATR